MNPKEKAAQLISDMSLFSSSFINAKYCALKAVREIRNNFDSEYWVEVEKEIRSSYGRK